MKRHLRDRCNHRAPGPCRLWFVALTLRFIFRKLNADLLALSLFAQYRYDKLGSESIPDKPPSWVFNNLLCHVVMFIPSHFIIFHYIFIFYIILSPPCVCSLQMYVFSMYMFFPCVCLLHVNIPFACIPPLYSIPFVWSPLRVMSSPCGVPSV